jgi:hypothetical protein
MDRRSILLSTVSLFAAAIVAGLGLLGLAVFWVRRAGRLRITAAAGAPPRA